MKTFLKVLLILVAALIAVKLLPLTIAVGFGLGIALLVVAALGLSAVAVLLCVAIGLAALLSPVWIPVLALFGVVALIKRASRSSSNPPNTPSGVTA